MISRGKRFFVTFFMVFYVLLTPVFSGGEPIGPVKSLMAMTQNSGRAYPKENRAVASGVGRIREDTAQARLLARRAALLDARRNLLALRRKLFDGPYSAPAGLSGYVGAHKIYGERTEGSLYFLEVEVPLDELLRADFTIDF